MAILLAKDVSHIENSFYDILAHAPGTKGAKQSFFLYKFHVRIPRTNYEVMWDRLVEEMGRAAAGEALFDYVLDTASNRLKDILSLAIKGEAVDLLSRDSILIYDLFWENGNPRRICEHLINYILETDFQWTNRISEGTAKEDFVSPRGSDVVYKYDIALSFAGEQRSYVEEIAKTLRSNKVSVFYDNFEEEELWGKDLVAHLDTVYRNMARYCIVFLSKEYANKAWPKMEIKSALARAVEEAEYILPVRFDDTDLPGLQPTIKYLDANKYTPKRIADITLKKLKNA